MIRAIQLEDLSNAPALTDVAAQFLQENCMLCFDHHSHVSGVHLDVDFTDQQEPTAVAWQSTVTDEMRRCYMDQDKHVDFGACAIALLLMPKFTEMMAVEQSAKGNGIDYYLANKGGDDHLIFNHVAVLEVSGILTENSSNTVNGRISRKRKRLRDLAGSPTSQTEDLPTYICVVEFSRPRTKVVLA